MSHELDLASMIALIAGGLALFLFGLELMTAGLKALAGSALRAVLSKAAATPLRGSFWGAIVTLLVQSSSATTMTTIGLVSAGLLTFPQGLGLVFGANVGTTGTAWLVALIGVRVSLTAAALPMIFVGALTKLLGRGRLAMRSAALVAGEVAAPHDIIQSPRVTSLGADATSGAAMVSTDEALVQVERCATELQELHRGYRRATLGAVANGTLTADAAIVLVDMVRSFEALARHAWRSAAYLVGRGE